MKTVQEILAEIDRKKKILLSDDSDENGWAYKVEELKELKSFILSGEECVHMWRSEPPYTCQLCGAGEVRVKNEI